MSDDATDLLAAVTAERYAADGWWTRRAQEPAVDPDNDLATARRRRDLLAAVSTPRLPKPHTSPASSTA
ncbi:hypothetical protein [Nocardioides nanhaiensis]|uniref:Uncharacterized protein n=1 Tax=Nocardioides nanhaiensis TaxID=1476871 RepID=A0ABP8W4P2_9ACTN